MHDFDDENDWHPHREVQQDDEDDDILRTATTRRLCYVVMSQGSA